MIFCKELIFLQLSNAWPDCMLLKSHSLSGKLVGWDDFKIMAGSYKYVVIYKTIEYSNCYLLKTIVAHFPCAVYL